MGPKLLKLTITVLSMHIIIISNIQLTNGLPSTKSDPNCLIYNFGDSNTDVGSGAALTGRDLIPPYGQQFYQESVGRFSNGRVYLDFICERLGRDYLSPYPEPLGSNFSSGASFAIGGATAVNTQFSLRTQVEQFGHLQKRTQKLIYTGKAPMINEEELKHAIYLIDIGQNDYHKKFFNNSSFRTIIHEISLSIKAIEEGIKALHVYAGARKFWISNTGPVGCLPSHIAVAKMYNISKLDKLGCVSMYNLAAKNFNNQLRVLCDRLRSELKDAKLVYVDMYEIKHALFAKPRKYGFENPLTSCCSAGTVCPTPSKSVIWDDTHFTEAAHEVIATKVLSGNYSTPRITLETLCKLRV